MTYQPRLYLTSWLTTIESTNNPTTRAASAMEESHFALASFTSLHYQDHSPNQGSQR